MTSHLVMFESHDVSPAAIGVDALLYVMRHGHTISIPTQALYFAEKLAIVSIAKADSAAPLLRSVNTAIDIIAQSIRTREQLDREMTLVDKLQTPLADDIEGGQRVPVLPITPVRPPQASAVKPDIAF